MVNRNRERRRSTVTFDLTKNISYDIEHCNELSPEHREAIWLTRDEYLECKQSFTAILKLMMKANGSIEETADICCRGLECRTKAGSRARSRVRSKAIWAVLDEQAIQRDENMEDSEFIADVYGELTISSSLEALNIGLKDQKAMMDTLDPAIRRERDQKIKSMLYAPCKDTPLIKPVRRATKVAESLVSASDLQSLKLILA